MKRLALLAVVLTGTGCTRDLELPGQSAFEVSASPITVAPRQTSVLTASGGTGALTFDFEAGGKLSGDDATVLPRGDGTADYVAGRNGSTQDTLTVTDSSGAVRRVIVTVGPRVSITPLVGATAPGGSLTFVASGGKSPYAFAVSPPGTGAVITVDPGDATKGHYVAGINGDVEETVTVTDATADPAASASATVRVGTQLGIYRTSSGPVAPNEEVTVVAYGGRAPYLFGPAYDALQPEAGGFKDLSKGVFTVGTAGGIGVVAQPAVTDQNGQVAAVSLEVGAALGARLATPLVRPGLTNRIAASGGKSPYVFRFSHHGNHSGGQVDSISGTYLPGRSPGALDRLEVEDATGTVTALTDVVPVGPIEIATGTDGNRCVAGDYDGDGTEDLAFLFRGMSLLEVNHVAATPFYRTYYVGDAFQFPAAFPEDHDRDGRSELHFIGSRSGGPTAGTTSLAYWALVPDMTGLFASPNGMMTSPFTASHGTRYVEDVALAHYTNYLTDQTAGCGGSLRQIQWLEGGGASVSSCSAPVDNLAGLGQATALVAGDFGGDGLADFAWLASSSDWIFQNTWNTPGPIHVRFMLSGTFVDGGSLELPPGTTFEGQGDGEQGRALRIPPKLPDTRDGLLLRLRRGDGRGVVAFATGNSLAWTFQQFDPFGGAGTGTTAVTVFEPYPGAPPLVAAVAGSGGEVMVFDPWAANPVATPVADVVFGASFGCGVDADADGFTDLAVGGAGSDIAAVLWGDGEGGFGSRPRLATGSPGGVSGDLDGDGLVDVATSDGVALSALFGDAGQLGWSESPVTTLPVASMAIARFVDQGSGTLAPRDSILFQALDGDYYLVRTNADGTFEPPLPLLGSSAPQANVPRVPHSWLFPADLGGYGGLDGSGPDLIAPENDNYGHSWIHVLIRPDADATLYEHMSPVVGDYRFSTPGGLIDKTHQCAYAPVHTGTTAPAFAVASLCAYEVPAGQPAAAWRVRGWPLAWSAPGWYDAPWVSAGTGGANAGAAGWETAVAAIGELGGKAYFLVATDRLLLAVVDPTASGALDPSGWIVTTTQLTDARRTTPYLARTADLDGDGDLDVVAGGEWATTVLQNVGTDAAPSFQYGYEVPAAGFPLAAGPLGFTDAAGTLPEKPSVVLGSPRGSYFQLLRTDGVGGLQ